MGGLPGGGDVASAALSVHRSQLGGAEGNLLQAEALGGEKASYSKVRGAAVTAGRMRKCWGGASLPGSLFFLSL